MSLNINEESETLFLDFVKENIVAKANDLAGGIKNPAGMTPHSSGAIRRLHENHLSNGLPDLKSPYFMRVDLANGKTYYYGLLSLSEPFERLEIPISHANVRATSDPFLIISEEKDEVGYTALRLDELDDLVARTRFIIRNGQIKELRTEDSGKEIKSNGVIAPEFVEEAITEKRQKYLVPIQGTLQPDQFKISRERVDYTLAIQGPPGSGKTVVLLERLSRVAFANPEIRSKGMLFIGPNLIFLDYISQVLPAKGKTDIELATFEKLVNWKPTYLKESEDAKSIKGDSDIAKVLEKAVFQSFRVLDKTTRITIQKITIEFTPMDSIVVLNKLEISEDTFPTKRGMAEKYVRDILINKFMARWNDQFGTEKNPKFDLGKLIVETKEYKSIVNRIAPNLKPLAVLNKLKTVPSYFYSLAKEVLSDEQIDLWVSNANTPTQKISVSDLPLLDYLEHLISASQRKWGHIAIDETQDLTPMQLRSIGLRFGPETTASLTGDLAQATGLFCYENWQDILEQFNIEMKSKITELTRSYRVPTEILNYANQFLESSGISVSPAVPFLDVPNSLEKVILKQSENFKTAAIKVIEKHLAADLSVLVIASESMKKEISAAQIRVPKDSLFRIMGPDEVKGLESDAVVIIDPLDIIFERYDGDPEDHVARRLYVMCTRSTKKLTLIGESEWDLDNLLLGIKSRSWADE